jgi:hypothetical protein
MTLQPGENEESRKVVGYFWPYLSQGLQEVAGFPSVDCNEDKQITAWAYEN